MPEQPESNQGSSMPLPVSLHDVAQNLRQAHHLRPEEQRALAELVDQLGKALDSTKVPPGEAKHLAESAAQLLQALQHRHDTNLVSGARERLEEAIISAENKLPFAAGIARRLMETLADLGI
jgi:hypothetical protein